jgi:hypothetical protein
LSKIEEDGRNWLRRPKLCTKSCRAVIRRRRVTNPSAKPLFLEDHFVPLSLASSTTNLEGEEIVDAPR